MLREPPRRHRLAKTLPQVRILHPQLKRKGLYWRTLAQPAEIVTMSQRRSCPRRTPADASPPALMRFANAEDGRSPRNPILAGFGPFCPQAMPCHDAAAPPRRLRTCLRFMELPRVLRSAEATCGLVGDQGGPAGASAHINNPGGRTAVPSRQHSRFGKVWNFSVENWRVNRKSRSVAGSASISVPRSSVWFGPTNLNPCSSLATLAMSRLSWKRKRKNSAAPWSCHLPHSI
jgi:hypothetical protein